jgi:hypothetical protein
VVFDHPTAQALSVALLAQLDGKDDEAPERVEPEPLRA